MRHPVNETISIAIEGLGSCCLVPLHHLNTSYTDYNHAKITAEGLGLTPLPVLSHEMVQEIFRTLALYFIIQETQPHVGVSVYLSGSHRSYSSVTKHPLPQKEDCVTSMELFFLGDNAPVEMTLCEVPVHETKDVLGDDLLYVMFFEGETM